VFERLLGKASIGQESSKGIHGGPPFKTSSLRLAVVEDFTHPFLPVFVNTPLAQRAQLIYHH